MNISPILLLIFSMQVSANTIEGAFGLKLGKLVPSDFKSQNLEDNIFEFKPKHLIPGFNQYSYRISPIGRKVVWIKAIKIISKSCRPPQSDQYINELIPILELKYGKFKHDEYSEPNRSTSDGDGGAIYLQCNYLTENGTNSGAIIGYERILEYSNWSEIEKANAEVKEVLIKKYNKFDL